MLVFAKCKINLGLRILRRRPDGYHDIETVMLPVPWCDIVEANRSESATDTLAVTGNRVDCPPEKNLCMKALRALRGVADFPVTDVRLHKIVPDGAGLGGGSSDAAATVRAVNDLYGLGLSDDDQAAVLATVGSDCPFFAYDRPMLATGTGTTLAPCDVALGGMHLVIAKPKGVAVSTAAAYAGVVPDADVEPLTEMLSLPVREWQGRLVNDFEPGIFKAAPQIKAVRDTLLSMGAVYAAMSGSGAAVFGLFDSPVDDLALKTRLYNCDRFTCRLKN